MVAFVRIVIEGPVVVSAASESVAPEQPRRSLLQVRRDASFATAMHCILLRMQLAPPSCSGADDSTNEHQDDQNMYEFMARERLALYRVLDAATSSRTRIEPSTDCNTYLVDGALLRLEIHDLLALRDRFQQRQDDARRWLEATNQRRERLADELMNFSAVPRDMKFIIWPSDSQSQPQHQQQIEPSMVPYVVEWSPALEREIMQRDLAQKSPKEQHTIATIIDQWRRRSYVVIALDDATMAVIDEAQQRASRFFDVARTLDRATLEHLSNSRAFRGFHERALFHKRFIMVRRWCEQVWQLNHVASLTDDTGSTAENPTLSPTLLEMQRLLIEMRHAAELAFDTLASIAECFTRLAARSVGLPDVEIDELFERHYRDPEADCSTNPTPDAESLQEAFSMSNMTFFHYDVPDGHEQQSVHCPMHSDVSLVTVIPRSVGVSGLFVYDWLLDKWIDFETNAPRNYAVLMGGESLARLSNHVFLTGMHEVSHVHGSRKSMPLQLLARREAVFDHDRLDASIVGDWKADDGVARRVSAGAFVEYTSSRRVSSNFPPTEARTPILQQ